MVQRLLGVSAEEADTLIDFSTTPNAYLALIEKEADLLLVAAEGAHLIACDERGRTYSSRAFADHVAILRDRGERRLVFAIGGADGLDPRVLEAAGSTLAFGPQTWPHALARAMLAEQLYRAVTILAGSPYHRD